MKKRPRYHTLWMSFFGKCCHVYVQIKSHNEKVSYACEAHTFLLIHSTYLSSLSVTKWIHFNWGDAGIIRLFTRAYQELRPGGVFILESQPFSSYAKKKHVSHVPHGQIALKPESFTAYLLDTIGFQSHQTIESGSSDSHTVSVQGKPEAVQNRPVPFIFCCT